MKRFLKIICAAAFVLMAFSMISAADTHAASLQYLHSGCMWHFQIVEKDGVQTAEITDVEYEGIQDEYNPKIMHMPAEVKSEGRTYQVSGIADGAFHKNSAVYVIGLPKTVTRIGDGAFKACENLKRIWFEEGSELESIGSHAFRDCKRLIYLEYYYGKIDNILPEGLKRIGDYAFFGSGVSRVQLPATLEVLGMYSFGGTSDFMRFRVSEDNQWFSADGFPDRGLLFSKDGKTLIKVASRIDKSVYDSLTDADQVTAVAPGAFAYCEMTPEAGSVVRLSDGITSVGDHAFMETKGLKEISIPSGVETLGEKTFFSAQDLEKAELSEGLKVIGPYAFGECGGLTDVNISDTVEKIDDGAFYKCTSLEKIYIPENVKYIGKDVFTGCDSLSLYGKAGSYAEQYAAENDLRFIPSELEYTTTRSQDINCPATMTVEAGSSRFIPGIGRQNAYLFKSYLPGNVKVSVNGKLTGISPGTSKVRVLMPEKETTYTDENGAKAHVIYKKKSKKVTVKCVLKTPSLKASLKKGQKIKLSWTKTDSATHYELYVKFPGKKSFKKVLRKKAEVKAVTHRGLVKGKSYSYKIRAICKEGRKIWRSSFSLVRTMKVK